ncbi:hypothetical protein NOK65_24315 [Vibrio parahaemolyticus]|uniref:hypothetical protein n=3 Tax=Vibrio parahaemolyticus TaxID=670 RepID=UPI00226BB7DB|nr:hypothetical protein [Vibrio parahaemolyticus]MCX8854967.1 hypothetical protein [Vibrio parahaemolyticus]HCG8756103.1 hypothetical protein [Vibrio parahaemolyticus]HCM0971104.1 hypothetical protein [Vibrio parahaemolyticus]
MNESREKLNEFIAAQKRRWNIRNENFGDNLDWNSESHNLGTKGTGWMKTSGRSVRAIFVYTGKAFKQPNVQIEDRQYQDFIRAYFMSIIPLNDAMPSASKTYDTIQLLRHIYRSLIAITGQTNPIYLNHEVFNHAIGLISEAKPDDLTNVANNAIRLQAISKTIDALGFTLTPTDYKSTYASVNTNYTKKAQRAKAAKAVPDGTADPTISDDKDKLITIKAFLNIVALINLTESVGEKIVLNLLLLLIVTGFRYEEASGIQEDALERIPVKGDALALAKKFNLPLYDLKIKYLGAKNSSATAHWVEPNAIALVESIFAAVISLTKPFREVLIKQRKSNFTDFLPSTLRIGIDGLVDLSDIDGVLVTTAATGGKDGRDRAKKTLTNLKIFPAIDIADPKNASKSIIKYARKDLNDGYLNFISKEMKLLSNGDGFFRNQPHKGKHIRIDYEKLLFIYPSGASSIGQNRSYNNIIRDVGSAEIARVLGSPNKNGRSTGISFFKKYGLVEEDGSTTQLTTHIPRHNVNTFLSIAGISEHLQAMLMGRSNIFQNQHYQHLTMAQKLKIPSLSEFDELESEASVPKGTLTNDVTENNDLQLDLFSFDTETLVTSHEINIDNNLSTDLDELFAGTLDDSVTTNPVEYVKQTGAMVFNPDLDLETNIKNNLHTLGSHEENAAYLAKNLSPNFMPDLNDSYSELIESGEEEKANDLLKTHSHLSSLPLGTCTRNLGLWGCPFGAKCQAGQECAYHALTGRAGELETIVNRSISNKKHVKILSELAQKDSSYLESLAKVEESYKVLERMKIRSMEALSKGIVVSLIESPTKEQLAVNKRPTTLADMFSIEQIRIEKGKQESKDEEAS